MIGHAVITLVAYFAALVALGLPLGGYMARVYQGRASIAGRLIGPLERALYRISGVRPDQEMTWKQYALALLAFNLFGLIAVYGIQRLQGSLPLNPQGLPSVGPEVSFNTAVSFTSNTNWQAYGGETGYKVLEAETAKEALQLATSHNPELILLDLGLPDRDGLEVVRELRGF